MGQLGPAMITVGGTLLTAAIPAAVTVLLYMLARGSKNNWIKIPGYVLAAGGALSTVTILLTGLGATAVVASEG